MICIAAKTDNQIHFSCLSQHTVQRIRVKLPTMPNASLFHTDVCNKHKVGSWATSIMNTSHTIQEKRWVFTIQWVIISSSLALPSNYKHLQFFNTWSQSQQDHPAKVRGGKGRNNVCLLSYILIKHTCPQMEKLSIRYGLQDIKCFREDVHW